MTSYDCVVVGGGISGVSAAYGLRRKGAKVLLIDAADHVGGAIHSIRTPDGYTLDCGPNTVVSKDVELWKQFSDLGIMDERLAADRKGGRRFILLDGKPELIPMSPVGLVKTPLLSTLAKLRVLAEPLIPRTHLPDESVSSFFSRRVGRQLADRLVDPFVAGVYAGNPKTTSVRSAFPSIWEAEQRGGSIVRGMIMGRTKAPKKPKGEKPKSVMFNFNGGLSAWPQAAARALGSDNVWLNTRARALRPLDGGWELTVERNGQTELVITDMVVLAVPAYVVADLVEGLHAPAAKALRAIPYPPMAVVHLGYKRSAVTHPLDGFGVLCPSGEGRKVLGVLWTSTLIPSSAPAGHVLTTSFVGGARTPEMARQSDSDIIDMVIKEHEEILGAQGTPAMIRVTRWQKAIPQYTAGHEQRVATLNELEAGYPGLFVVGNYRDGLSVSQCWNKGIGLAEQVVRQGTLRQCTPTSAF
ncbi:MAG: protoporphyrinogen oxidase [Chloroflexales bacterium]